MGIPTSFASIGLNDEEKRNRFIAKILELYSQVEGGYDSVNASDGTAMSIGILQWHGVRAQTLLKKMAAHNKEKAMLMGAQLYQDIDEDSNFWSHRTASPDEVFSLKELLPSSVGRQAQNELATEDICAYLLHGIELGITDLKALAYFCDLENQGGQYVVEEIVGAIDSRAAVSLDNLCMAALMNPAMGFTRRRRRLYCYTKVSELFKDGL